MKPPILLKERELIAWFLINDAAKRFFSAVDKEMRSLGLTRAQWYLLTHVYYFEGLTQQELADRMDLTKSSAAKLIRKLEAKHWVQREDDKSDGRLQRVFLLPAVKPLIQALSHLARDALSAPLSALDEGELKTLTKLLQKLDADTSKVRSKAASTLAESKAEVEKLLKLLRRGGVVS